MNETRVVVTGMGVVSPNGVGLKNFKEAIKNGTSGIRYYEELERLNFRCQIGGEPDISDELMQNTFTDLELKRLTAPGVIYGIIAGMEAWDDAGLSVSVENEQEPIWEAGTIFGTGMCAMETAREAFYKTDDFKVKRLGTTIVEQTMPSGISAFLGGRFGLGNQVSSNASACSTGSESIIMCYERIKAGKAKIMLAGGCDGGGPYVWGGFDAMRVLCYKYNDSPETASRPLSASAAGFVPGSGGGALVLESLESALERGAHIYGEILGGHTNSGGQRGSGTMTAPNAQGTQRCIKEAIASAGIEATDIDLISGHLTSTMGDVLEINNWSKAMGLSGEDFPMINSLKSMTGHCLSGAGAIESIASFIQLEDGFIHPSLNMCELHPDIAKNISEKCVPQETQQKELNIIAKSSFGFGDVNSCLIFKKYQ
jgi:3-oxoacyl-(acyl-carrier-protein) synthase